MVNDEEWISVVDAAAILDITRGHVHNLMRAGRLVWRPKINVPRSPREILKSSVVALLPDNKKSELNQE